MQILGSDVLAPLRRAARAPGWLAVDAGSKLRAWAFDVVVAVVVTAIALWGSIAEASPTSRQPGGAPMSEAQYHQLLAHQPGGFYALVVIAGLALVWRRRYPVAVLAVTVVCDGIYAGAGFVDGALLVPVLVSLYTVASLGARRASPVLPAAVVRREVTPGQVGGVVALGVGWLAAGLGGPFGWLSGPNSVRWAVTIAAVAVGTVRGNRRQLLAAMTERAERAEQTREEEARRRVDAERLRIARELHDVVAHSM
ncbi:MAG: hypothetical protein J2O39_08945, partial [Acidimicrobiales bacterium]|nr:hypothetical protein [Acidimicrobiales bacterium]